MCPCIQITSNKRVCVKFVAWKGAKVFNTKPVAVHVYDYYDPGQFSSIGHWIPSRLCHCLHHHDVINYHVGQFKPGHPPNAVVDRFNRVRKRRKLRDIRAQGDTHTHRQCVCVRVRACVCVIKRHRERHAERREREGALLLNMLSVLH